MSEDLKLTLLREKRRIAFYHMKSSHSLYIRAKKLYDSISVRYFNDKEEYEHIDHELALIDGRLHIESPNKCKHTRSRTANVELTEDQIIAIAKELNISLPEVEVREEDEEIVKEEMQEVFDPEEGDK